MATFTQFPVELSPFRDAADLLTLLEQLKLGSGMMAKQVFPVDGYYHTRTVVPDALLPAGVNRAALVALIPAAPNPLADNADANAENVFNRQNARYQAYQQAESLTLLAIIRAIPSGIAQRAAPQGDVNRLTVTLLVNYLHQTYGVAPDYLIEAAMLSLNKKVSSVASFQSEMDTFTATFSRLERWGAPKCDWEKRWLVKRASEHIPALSQAFVHYITTTAQAAQTYAGLVAEMAAKAPVFEGTTVATYASGAAAAAEEGDDDDGDDVAALVRKAEAQRSAKRKQGGQKEANTGDKPKGESGGKKKHYCFLHGSCSNHPGKRCFNIVDMMFAEGPCTIAGIEGKK